MISFIKAHACGNDFLILEEPVAGDRAEVARRLCTRTTGIGADGIEYLSMDENGGFSIRLFNADGSESEISGNGTRCVAAYLAQQQDLNEVAIHTEAGLRRCRVLASDTPRFQIATEMGVPTVATKTVQLEDGTKIEGFHVSIGNPHFVTFVESTDFACFRRPWQQIGSEICVHPDFPHGTNVEFVRVLDTNTIEFRIYERGVGPTQSSGTGTSASATAAIHAKNVSRALTVIAEGGTQTVNWPAANAQLLLTGPAEIIAQGECLLV